ncbi:MAG: HD domain-containing phosphohydrolase [Rhodospirillaceae bacterium]
MGDCRSKPSIALVDSNPNDRKALAHAIQSFYSVSQFTDADSALDGLRRAAPALIIVDEMVTPCGAYDFVSMVRADRTLAEIPAVVVSALDLKNVKDSIRRCGGNGYLPKAWKPGGALKTISVTLNKAVERKWETLPELQREALKGTLAIMNKIPEALAAGTPISYTEFKKTCVPLVNLIYLTDVKGLLDAVKEYDNYTFAHSFKVGTMLAMFGCAIGLKDRDQILLASGGLLHDVGKMAIPLEVLNKPGRLEAEEWTIMKSHVPTTMEFLATCGDIPKGALIIAGQHHEKLDGTGYPHGLAGMQLNELARMAAIVDIFGALTDRRSYKPAMDSEAALKIMSRQMAAQIDMDLLKMFREVVLDQTR